MRLVNDHQGSLVQVEYERTVTIRRGRLGAGRLGAGTFMRLDFYALRLLGARGKKFFFQKKIFLNFFTKNFFSKKNFFFQKVVFQEKIFFSQKQVFSKKKFFFSKKHFFYKKTVFYPKKFFSFK